jgi:hypothetical protein
MENDERIEELRRIAQGLVDTFLHLHVAIGGVRIEIDAIKSMLTSNDPLKQQDFAQRIAIAANNMPPALQQIHVKLQRYRADLEALAPKPKPN